MGAWGPGLYANDFALDVKAAVAAVARLPLDADELTRALCSANQAAAGDTANPDYEVFWLVVADQFEKRGIFGQQVHDIALGLIDTGADAAKLQALGMKAADIRKRAEHLAALRASLLAQPQTTRTRPTLGAPQPYVFDLGGVYAYPTLQGRPLNPYLAPAKFNRANWIPDGFGLLLVLGRGRAFGYLTWYVGVTSVAAVARVPDLPQLADDVRWRAPPAYGTCSPQHVQRLELQPVGVFPIDPDRRDQFFPHLATGEAYAIQNIGISEKLEIGGHEPRGWTRGADGKLKPIIYPAAPTLNDLIVPNATPQ